MFFKLYNIKSTAFVLLRGNQLNYLFRDDDNDSYKVRVLPLKLRTQYDSTGQHELLVESSKKIACIKVANDYVHLYNLFTGDSHAVLDAPLQGSLCYGFGYDCYEDDYKFTVVCRRMPLGWLRRLNDPNVKKIDAHTSLIIVYSYRNRRWKSLKGFPHASYMWFDRAAYSINGVLYWVVDKIDGTNRTKVIAALDVHSYGLAEIALPPNYYYPNSNANVTELEGQLCCWLERRIISGHTEVWVMKESWTKLFSIQISTPFFYERCYIVGLYKRRDARKIGVFSCPNSKLELFRCDIDKDEIQVFSCLKDIYCYYRG